jgi:hypothetical protein
MQIEMYRSLRTDVFGGGSDKERVRMRMMDVVANIKAHKEVDAS